MTHTRRSLVGLGFVAAIAALGLTARALDQAAASQAGGMVQAPKFEVDPMWPKPLPNNWILGQVGGITVDWQGHI
jgi:hypothetical protein